MQVCMNSPTRSKQEPSARFSNSVLQSARVVNQVTGLQAELFKTAGVLVRFRNSDIVQYSFPEDFDDTTLRRSESVGGIEQTHICDSDGISVAVDPTSPSIPRAEMNENGGVFPTFSLSYPWRKAIYIRTVVTTTNNFTSETLTFASEWSMSEQGHRVIRILQKFKNEIDWNVLWTSDNSTLVKDSEIPTVTSTQHLFVSAFSEWLLASYRKDTVAESLDALDTDIMTNQRDVVIGRNVAGKSFITHHEIRSEVTTKRTESIVFSIMGGVVFMGTLFAFLMSRQIKLVVRQIVTLKDLRLNEVLTHERSMKRTSFVLELADLQHSFCEMVLTFVTHLKFGDAAAVADLGIREEPTLGNEPDPSDLPTAS
ncbi:hypothetical protein BC829DRAFT_431272 [Chytridium lagenaria]|nr:hypothetical protein BC829DRAFT_431272 [Chytridium lagenaria]